MSEWREVELREIAELSNGANFSKESFGLGLKILGVRDFGDRLVPDWSSVDEVRPSALTSNRQLLRDGDILFVRSNGNPALVGRSLLVAGSRAATHSAFTIRVRPDRTVVDPRFLAYQARAVHRSGGLNRGSGTNITNLNQERLGSLKVALPDRGTQLEIVAVLSAFDELIAINERRIELLENLAQSLYREWFVRFRFPGHEIVELVGSELGRIPKGWEVTRLGDVADVNERTVKAKDLPDPLVYIDISSVGDRRITETTEIGAADAPGRARRRLLDGDVLWATVRPNRRAHALVHDPPPNVVASTGLAVLTAVKVPSSFLFEWSSTPAFGEYLIGRATGSAYPAVRPMDFIDADLVVPNLRILERFSDAVDPLHRLTSRLLAQNSVASSTRDLLLPRLVTGRLDVSDVDLGALVPSEVV